VKKILIIKHGSLGDIIMSLIAFFSIRNYFIKDKLYLLTEKKYKNFFKKSFLVDEIIEDNRDSNLIKNFKKIQAVAKNNFDFIIDLQNSKRTFFYNLLFRFFTYAKINSSRPLAHYRYNIPKQGKETVSEGLMNQLNLMGIKKSEEAMVDYNWLRVDIIDEFKEPLAIFIPGVSRSGFSKQWQPEKFAIIAKNLEDLGYTICVLGTNLDLDSAKPIIKSCKKILNKIDKSPPEIIYSLALKAKIIFSNDTGPGHIAALAKKNFIRLVNNNNLSKTSKPSGSHIFDIQDKSVKNIQVSKVMSFLNAKKLI